MSVRDFTVPPWSVQRVNEEFGISGLLAATDDSREVSWALAHAALWPVIERACRRGALPLIGSHAWLELPEGDPRKVGAVWLAADWQVLHLELDQDARIEALQAVSDAADWPAIGRFGRDRAAFEAANPWAKRVAS